MTTLLGIDIGSMTVKGVLFSTGPGPARPFNWYARHHGRPARAVGLLLKDAARENSGQLASARVFVTGSGAGALAPLLNALFIQEVNAAAAVIEQDFPHVRTAIDLGGQDAKILAWQEDARSARLRRFTSMNDKCAGGTGATIDRIVRKLGVTPNLLSSLRFDPARIHPIAGKCGIFAESDVNSLLKNGVPVEECLLSLFAAIIDQNITTLAKGRVLRPPVLLLGGPNAFIPAMRSAWAYTLRKQWREESIPPDSAYADDHVRLPEDAVFFAARGCALLGSTLHPANEENRIPALTGLLPRLSERDAQGRVGSVHALAGPGFDTEMFRASVFSSAADLQKEAPACDADLFLGIDAGSTSTKGVVIDNQGKILARAYRLGDNNPLREAQLIVRDLAGQLEPTLHRQIRSLTLTGYAKDYLNRALEADHVVVETVAHMLAACWFYGEIDVVLDVGGQDIKIIFLKQGMVTDFRLNTQCSAGNGFYLQNAASRFHIPLEDFASAALSASAMPRFNTGCAVFLESDIVQYLQEGWAPDQILAGLAAVLPKNVWEYVVQEPNLARLGRRFVLQGGAHRNLAVVKAQRDYIGERVPGAEVIVHRYCAETGALGAALEGLRQHQSREAGDRPRSDVFARIAGATYETRRNESTRCALCSNRCQRTFITVRDAGGPPRTLVVASCEKGSAQHAAGAGNRSVQGTPNGGNIPDYTQKIRDGLFSLDNASPTGPLRSSREARRIGIPRTLNMWRYGAFFRSYLQAIGIPPQNIVWSDVTSQGLWQEGGRYNTVDLCYPGKYGVAHVYNLLRKNVGVIFNPALATLDAAVTRSVASAACPVAMASPDVVKASFTGMEDLFQRHGTAYHAPVFHLHDPEIFSAELCRFSRKAFGINRDTHETAFRLARACSDRIFHKLRSDARETLARIVQDGTVGILFLARPYHYDPGLNHGIPSELRARGYPVFTIESLPQDNDILGRLFEDDIREGCITDPREIGDVWKHSLSENANRKVWAAKFAARVPNLAVIDFVSFRCGPDATILHVVERIARAARTPYFTFHDMDQNNPAGSIRLRIETIDYFLGEYQAGLRREGNGSGIF